jgi:hypothetical protein
MLRPLGSKTPGVLERHDAVAEQAPALLRMTRHDLGRLAIRRARRRTGWLMWTHEPLGEC